jgi:hypothetical protein
MDFQTGQRVRAKALLANYSIGVSNLRRVGGLNALKPRRAQLRQIGATGEIAGAVNGVVHAYFVRIDGEHVPFYAQELELAPPERKLPSDLEGLVLELLTIFPNANPSSVLNGQDKTDIETTNLVVPALRALLRNSETLKVRRQERKAAQSALRNEIRHNENLLTAARRRLELEQATVAELRSATDRLRTQLGK